MRTFAKRTPWHLPINAMAVLALCTFLPSAYAASPAIFAIANAADEDTFLDSIATAGLNFIGRESFPSVGEGMFGTTPAAQVAPGVPAGPLFPTGTNPALGLFFQTNSLGGNPATLSPGGQLYAVGPLPADNRAWLGPDLSSNSLDIIIDPPAYRGQIQAFSFAVATTAGSPVVVRLYDNENNLQGSEILAVEESMRIGIVLSGDSLFRVNVWAPSGFVDVGQLDLYAIPEPATAAFISALAAFWIVRRRRSL